MINQVHPNTIIGIKKLTPSDLGFADNGMTHIGLFKNTFNSLDIIESLTIPSTLLYENNSFDLLSIIDPITRANGDKNAPKIRKGKYDYEFIFNGIEMNSITKKVREIAEYDQNIERYFLWFEIDSGELIYLLFDEQSIDFIEITGIVGDIANRKIKIGSDKVEFGQLVNFLNAKIETLNFEYYTELEIISQTGSKSTKKRVIPRPRDIEKANKLFKATGIKGEELLNEYLKSQKNNDLIKDFVWLNQSIEQGMPYDFEITYLDNSKWYSDAKTTGYNFEQPMVLSTGELSFIDRHKENYLIHRIYSINDEPKFKICNNIFRISDIFLPNLEIFDSSLRDNGLSIWNLNLAIPTASPILNFNEEIQLFSNA